jgi:hypothetical protein
MCRVVYKVNSRIKNRGIKGGKGIEGNEEDTLQRYFVKEGIVVNSAIKRTPELSRVRRK